MASLDPQKSALTGLFFSKYHADMPIVERENLLARVTFRSLCVLSTLIGLAWLLGDPNRSTAVSYATVRDLGHALHLQGDPVRWFGGLVLLLGIGGLVSSFLKSEERTMAFATGLVMFWTYWLVNSLYALTLDRASLISPCFNAFLVIGHLRAPLSSHRITIRAYPPPSDHERTDVE